MQVYVCGIPDELEAFVITVPEDALSSWNGFRLYVYNKMRNRITHNVLIRYFSPLYITGLNGILGCHDDLKAGEEVVILPRGSHCEDADIEAAANKHHHDDDLNWADRLKTFNYFNEYTEQAQVKLTNLHFKQIESRIVKCQICHCVQRVDDFFIPIMLQHGIASPSCPGLEMWNGKMHTSASIVSSWAKELVHLTVKTLNASKFYRTLRNSIRKPDRTEHNPNAAYICSICLVNPAEIIYLPCLHLTTCVLCHESKNNNNCQNCMQPISMSSKVFS